MKILLSILIMSQLLVYPSYAAKTYKYIPGTCKQLWVKYRLANFPKGDPNYTKRRDRDNDGIACDR
jgi:hypothetical protein